MGRNGRKKRQSKAFVANATKSPSPLSDDNVTPGSGLNADEQTAAVPHDIDPLADSLAKHDILKSQTSDETKPFVVTDSEAPSNVSENASDEAPYLSTTKSLQTAESRDRDENQEHVALAHAIHAPQNKPVLVNGASQISTSSNGSDKVTTAVPFNLPKDAASPVSPHLHSTQHFHELNSPLATKKKSRPTIRPASETASSEDTDGSKAVPEIPPMALERQLSVSDMVMMDATRQQVVQARPVIISHDDLKVVELDKSDSSPSRSDSPGKLTIRQVNHASTKSPDPSPMSPEQKLNTHDGYDSPLTTTATASSPNTSITSNDYPSSTPRSAKPVANNDCIKDTLDSIVGVCVVGFHHTRGPEVEYWIGPGHDQSATWPLLPFQSLPDGSHQFEENIVYFTLLYDQKSQTAPNPTFQRDEEGHIIHEHSDYRNVVTLFAIACSRQTPIEGLTQSADEEYTRATVQKSVVVIARKPIFGPIKEKLIVVTRSYFEQKNFSDRGIIDHLYHNLVHLFSMPLSDSDLQVGINLQDFVRKFGPQVLLLFKALLLELKVLFHASDTEVLCTTQFALISLIPNLLNHLEDCGSPLLSGYETTLKKQNHLKAADRESLLSFMGLPLQVFAAGGMFSPFVPLQHLEELRQKEMQYGLIGTTNNLFLTSGVNYDILVDIDNNRLELTKPQLKHLLQLSTADRAFIDPLVQSVRQGWDDNNRWEPQSLGYHGSEDYVRHQFEDYIMALAASAKYDSYAENHPAMAGVGSQPRDFPNHPLKEFGSQWAERWKGTNNYRIFDKFTDDELFDVVDPVHVGLSNQGFGRMGRVIGLFRRPQQHHILGSGKEPKDQKAAKDSAIPLSSDALTLTSSRRESTPPPASSSSSSVKSPNFSKLAFWK